MLMCYETRTHKVLSNKLKPVTRGDRGQKSDIETQWEYNKMFWLGTCEEVLGKMTQHKDLISANTIHKI